MKGIKGSVIVSTLVLTVVLTIYFLQNYSPIHDFKFVNSSSYDINVQPDNQMEWEGFDLEIGSTHVISIKGKEVFFSYDHIDDVLMDEDQEDVVFIDIQ